MKVAKIFDRELGFMDRDKKDHRDTFDRVFIGSPGFMIIVVLVIIIGSLFINYFK